MYNNQYKIVSLASNRHVKIDKNTRSDNQNLPVDGPFKIFVDVFADYVNYIEDDDADDEIELEAPKLTKSYKTEQCVICFNNEPNILC